MTGSMFAAISGLKSHMQKLSVIGNNIANINTVGYKAGRTLFQSSLYTSLSSGSGGTATVGGRNPSQIGYGTQIGSVDIDMSTGTYSPTGNPMDCMIEGDGFFLVGNKSTADVINPMDVSTFKSLTLTRVGAFDFKADNYLTDLNGNVVYGFLTTGVNADGTPIVSDQLVPIRLPRMDPDTGEVRYPKEGDGDGHRLEDDLGDDADNPNPFVRLDSISIDEKTGKITGVTKDTDLPVTIGFIAIGSVANPNGVTQENNSYYKAGDGAGDLSITLLGGAAETLSRQGGGFLTHVNASTVDDPDALPTGAAVYSGGKTFLRTSGLEGSKTDLATEISEMITTQRGYQANTRIITVTDAMLEELVNIKR